MLRLAPSVLLALMACYAKPSPASQPHSPAPRGLCTPDEVVVFSCPLETGAIISLCASPDVAQGSASGTIQFRSGKIGALDMVYPPAPKSPEFFTYVQERFARSMGDSVSFSSHLGHMTLRDRIGSGHPGEGESNNFKGLIDQPYSRIKDEREVPCAQPPISNLKLLKDWAPPERPKAQGLTGIEMGEQIPPAVVYDGPGGKRLGVLEADDGHSPFAIVKPLRIRQDDGTFLPIESMWGTRETRYEVHSLMFFAQEDGHSQILPFAGKRGLWIKDAESAKYRAVPWAEYLAKLGDRVLWHEDLKGLQIHRSPKDASPAKTLADGVYEFSPTGRHTDGWLEVKVKGYTDDFTCGGTGKPNGKTWKGWIRGGKDGGEPQVWHYSRGC